MSPHRVSQNATTQANTSCLKNTMFTIHGRVTQLGMNWKESLTIGLAQRPRTSCCPRNALTSYNLQAPLAAVTLLVQFLPPASTFHKGSLALPISLAKLAMVPTTDLQLTNYSASIRVRVKFFLAAKHGQPLANTGTPPLGLHPLRSKLASNLAQN